MSGPVAASIANSHFSFRQLLYYSYLSEGIEMKELFEIGFKTTSPPPPPLLIHGQFNMAGK